MTVPHRLACRMFWRHCHVKVSYWWTSIKGWASMHFCVYGAHEGPTDFQVQRWGTLNTAMLHKIVMFGFSVRLPHILVNYTHRRKNNNCWFCCKFHPSCIWSRRKLDPLCGTHTDPRSSLRLFVNSQSLGLACLPCKSPAGSAQPVQPPRRLHPHCSLGMRAS